jgi:hypothetical protein
MEQHGVVFLVLETMKGTERLLFFLLLLLKASNFFVDERGGRISGVCFEVLLELFNFFPQVWWCF